MKKVLVLGGTQFIGRNVVERLLELEQYERCRNRCAYSY